MMKKFTVFLWAAVLTFGFALTGCPTDGGDKTDNRHSPYGSPPYTGIKTGTGSVTDPNEHINRVVDIRITLKNGYIESVEYGEGTINHTADIGKRLVLDKAPNQIIKVNSIDDLRPPDVMAGASVSKHALILAYENAMGDLLD
jgi:hypothetical protein